MASQFCMIIISPENGVKGKPMGIAVHPEIGRLFWGNTNSGDPGSIYSNAMDGSGSTKVADTGVDYPDSIVIDYENSTALLD